MHHLNSQSTFSDQVLSSDPTIFPCVFLTEWWPPIHFDSPLVHDQGGCFQFSGLRPGSWEILYEHNRKTDGGKEGEKSPKLLMVHGLFKNTCVAWTLDLALPWIIHNAGIESPLARKSYWVTHHHMRQACLQTVLKIARIHRPLPVHCLFPSHKRFGSLASSLVANSTQLNKTTSLVSMLGHQQTAPSQICPWGLAQSSQKSLPWLKYALGETQLPHIRIQQPDEEARSEITH